MSSDKTQRAADFGMIQLPRHLGLAGWQFHLARKLGLIPPADLPTGRWSAEAAEELTGRLEHLLALVGAEPPIGVTRSAQRLAERTGLDVTSDDVHELVGHGVLASIDEFIDNHGRPHGLYRPVDLDRTADESRELLERVLGDRLAWVDASLDRPAAAAALGWRLREFDKVVADRCIAPGRLGRYARIDIEILISDEELVAQVDADRLLGSDQAAARLQIRRTDLEYLLLAGLLTAVTKSRMRVGYRREVQVPLYRTSDVDALLDLREIDWETLRGCGKGDPSPLREIAGPRPPSRAQVVRRWIGGFADRHNTDVWAIYRGSSDRWEIDWDMTDGHPSTQEVAAAIAEDPVVAQYRDDLVLSTTAGAATRWARRMLEPDTAVILDTETTDLLDPVVIEVAVIDASTGAILLDTLVNPAGAPINPEAAAVHGISNTDLAGAPTWASVLPQLARVTENRMVLAYNADFDQDAILHTSARSGSDPVHLADSRNWGCVMDRRADWLRAGAWLGLGGAHRALGDCHAARDVLCDIARRREHTASRTGCC